MEEAKVVLHKGIFKPTSTVTEAVFLITGMTIGAGILAIPYAVSTIGLLPGLAYIFALGMVMLFLNLMIGEIAVRTKEHLQLPGFAEKYLGKWAKNILSTTILLSSFGTLLVYVIGEGESLAALFGGNKIIWSVIFWSIGSFVIWGGLKRIKIIDKVFGFGILFIIIGLSFFLLPKFQLSELSYFNSNNILFPLGVILFALHASPAIAEAHALLPGSQRHFRRALVLGTLIPIGVYTLFTIAVVGFTGQNTTEIATVGLGQHLGPVVGILANIFAVLAMSTCFIGLGTALQETLVWDHKFPHWAAVFLVISVPLILFLLGARSFINVLGTVGGIFIGVEGIIMAGIYLSARKQSDINPERYLMPRHALLVSIPVFLFFSSFLFFSIYNFFLK